MKENLGQVPAAIELYRHHLEAHPDDVSTRRRLVGLYMRADRLPEAYANARRITQTEPDDVEALQIQADLALKTKHDAEAERTLLHLRSVKPDDPEPVARAVAVLSNNGRGREAARIADEWAARHAGHPAGPLLAVRGWLAAGVPDSAVARARAAVALAPDSTDAHRLLARVLQDAGRYREAELEWLVLRARLPDEPGVLLDLGGCRERAGDIDGAVAAGRDALKLRRDWAPALNYLGYVLADHERELPEALRLIEEALKQDPDNGAYVDSFGWALYRLGQVPEARVQLERAVGLTNGDPVVREHLGDVYLTLHLPTLAREQYQVGLAARGENNRRVREKLRALR